MRGAGILVVDDEQSMRAALAEALDICGYQVETAENGVEALARFSAGKHHLVITDLRMPKMGGMELLKEIKSISPVTPVVVITAYGTVNTAVAAMKTGAAEFIMKPFSLDELRKVVQGVLKCREEENFAASDLSLAEEVRQAAAPEIITQDERMNSILDLLKNVAKSKCSILIQGESGTGKEMFARFVLHHSHRRGQPFIAVNCAAIPDNLLESEMFGYEKGAFTGAGQKKAGKFELAHGGTLLLDEIGEMGMHLQAKLLRVLQEGEVDRLGSRAPLPVDVRILATTNADLRFKVANKTFREDLYYRLNVIAVKVPPLRERKGDIPLLAERFLRRPNSAGPRGASFSPATLAMMEKYSWPGNVRELENAVARALLVCPGKLIEPGHLFSELDWHQPAEPLLPEAAGEREAKVEGEVSSPLQENKTLREMERNLILETLKKVEGNRTTAAKMLGISVRTMRNKLREYGLT
jgi:two-component system response regulator FlrC